MPATLRRGIPVQYRRSGRRMGPPLSQGASKSVWRVRSMDRHVDARKRAHAASSSPCDGDRSGGCRIRDRERQRLGDEVQALPARGRGGSRARAVGHADGQPLRCARQVLPACGASVWRRGSPSSLSPKLAPANRRATSRGSIRREMDGPMADPTWRSGYRNDGCKRRCGVGECAEMRGALIVHHRQVRDRKSVV